MTFINGVISTRNNTIITNTDDLEEFFKSLFNNKCDLNYKIIER